MTVVFASTLVCWCAELQWWTCIHWCVGGLGDSGGCRHRCVSRLGDSGGYVDTGMLVKEVRKPECPEKTPWRRTSENATY